MTCEGPSCRNRANGAAGGPLPRLRTGRFARLAKDCPRHPQRLGDRRVAEHYASARVTELVADLVDPAKATAFEKLGKGEQAQRIAIGWLRPKLLLATPA